MFHRPSVRSRKSVIIIWLYFKMFTSNLVKMARQFSSQSFTMDMREPVVMLLKTWADCALVEILFDSFKVACKSGLMIFLSATQTVGKDVVCVMWEQCGKALG